MMENTLMSMRLIGIFAVWGKDKYIDFASFEVSVHYAIASFLLLDSYWLSLHWSSADHLYFKWEGGSARDLKQFEHLLLESMFECHQQSSGTRQWNSWQWLIMIQFVSISSRNTQVWYFSPGGISTTKRECVYMLSSVKEKGKKKKKKYITQT